MDEFLSFPIEPQPDDTTCGPTCLQAVYRYFGDHLPVAKVVNEVPKLETGGTLAVLLACHALQRGYSAVLYTYNLQVFDPSWFALGRRELIGKLREHLETDKSPRVRRATRAYLRFVELGGDVRLEDLTTTLIRRYLRRNVPVLAGLSATYLYRTQREIGAPSRFDDLNGTPQGHFVVLCGYSSTQRRVRIADPLYPNPMAADHYYAVGIDRLVTAIMLGVLTFDANLLVLQPRRRDGEGRHP